jgi:hypothetical protein
MVVGMREVKLDLCGWDFFNHSCGLVGLLPLVLQIQIREREMGWLRAPRNEGGKIK